MDSSDSLNTAASIHSNTDVQGPYKLYNGFISTLPDARASRAAQGMYRWFMTLLLARAKARRLPQLGVLSARAECPAAQPSP